MPSLENWEWGLKIFLMAHQLSPPMTVTRNISPVDQHRIFHVHTFQFFSIGIKLVRKLQKVNLKVIPLQELLLYSL